MDSSTFQALVDKVQQVMARDISRFYGKQSAVKITYSYFPYIKVSFNGFSYIDMF